jgi:L-lactate dehydrogenase (cytochrome)
LHKHDARRARESGVDGIILSNHGGRQLDGAVSPLRVLSEIAETADLPVMIDGGIRRGTDVLKALALGAKFVFVGRPFFYAAAIGGAAGVRHGIDLLAQEIDRNMALLGINTIAEMRRELVIHRARA